MRMNKQQRQEAKDEIYEILSHRAMRSRDLSGTPKFHGWRTLSYRQVYSILRQLRDKGKVEMSVGPAGELPPPLAYVYWEAKRPEGQESSARSELAAQMNSELI